MKPPTLEQVAEAVIKVTGVEFTGGGRTAEMSQTKALYCKFALLLIGRQATTEKLGKVIGRSHCTVCHYIKQDFLLYKGSIYYDNHEQLLEEVKVYLFPDYEKSIIMRMDMINRRLVLALKERDKLRNEVKRYDRLKKYIEFERLVECSDITLSTAMASVGSVLSKTPHLRKVNGY